MIPFNAITPNKIQGTKIAAGRATWIYDEGKGYYNFVDEDAFAWKLNPTELEMLKIDEQDLLDCVEQAEKQLGSPADYRGKLGLMPSSGYSNIGATYTSKSNPRIICVFTPTSTDYQTTNPIAIDNAPIDAYFEWYYMPETASDEGKDLMSFIKKYDDLLGKAITRDISWENNPTFMIPKYEEACVFSSGFMNESVRESFLQNVWDYHKSNIRGRKLQLESTIKETWMRLNRVKSSVAMYQ
jgi:hypothetical protein